ncbi:MAG TPA: prolyl oligopeptidase family serine peptidase [Candidatus Acidoferrales bacterium]|nr:prolyl oligopeptidase family serine peptidase [Candidatus Acidoferrales bacterium]
MKNAKSARTPGYRGAWTWFAAGALVIACIGAAAAQEPAKAPETRRDNVTDDYSGVKVADPYRWLEDQNSPETRAWIEKENQYTRAVLDGLPGRKPIEKRLTALMKVDAFGVPTERGGRLFYSKRVADQDLSVLYERNGVDGKEEVLVDPHPMSKDHTTSVNLSAISLDGSLVAVGVREGGADEVAVHLYDAATRRELPEGLPKARYLSFEIASDNHGIYYTLIKKEGPRAYFHPLGTQGSQDTEIFGSSYGPEMLTAVSISEDGRYLLFHVFHGSAGDTSEVYYQDLKRRGPITPLVKGIPARFTAEVAGGRAYIHTNWKAPRGRILVVDLQNPALQNWREVVPQGEFPIEAMALVGGKLLVRYTVDASSRLWLYEADGKLVREISLPTLGTVSGTSGRWGSNDVFFGFQSFTVPQSVYHLDLAKGTVEEWAKPSVAIDAEAFETEQVHYESKDGTRVLMFLVHRKKLERDRERPVLLTGYGGFNVSETPSFSAYAVLYAEQGGVYALPNLRGGGEFGEEWHKAGMHEKKQNVFDDFLGAAEWLIAQRYTRPAKLSIRGQSNGGLLVGAAVTERPDLFGAVVCRYPLLDMLRYQNFLVARFWVPEYGSSDKPEEFKYLRAYSPYQNVKQGTKYPAVLFVTGDGDTRVAPLHARKMAAEMQEATASGKPVLLLYDTQSGHSGGRPVGKLIEEATDEMVFLFGELGVNVGP